MMHAKLALFPFSSLVLELGAIFLQACLMNLCVAPNRFYDLSGHKMLRQQYPFIFDVECES